MIFEELTTFASAHSTPPRSKNFLLHYTTLRHWLSPIKAPPKSLPISMKHRNTVDFHNLVLHLGNWPIGLPKKKFSSKSGSIFWLRSTLPPIVRSSFHQQRPRRVIFLKITLLQLSSVLITKNPTQDTSNAGFTAARPAYSISNGFIS